MSRLGRLAKIHQWPGWTAWAAIIGGLALIVALLAWWNPQSPTGDTAASSKSPTPTLSADAPGVSTPGSRTGGTAPSSEAIIVVREDVATMGYGDSLNMETGAVGKVVDKPDITYVVAPMDQLVPLQGGIAEISAEITARNCATALEKATPSTTRSFGGGDWFCVKTSAQHIAAVAVLSRADRSTPGKLRYIVWSISAAG